jgi:hypothetical protein
MFTRVYVAAVMCVLSGAALAQQLQPPPPPSAPFQTQNRNGVYTTKNPAAGTKFIFKGDAPFGRISPDAMVPVPTGPRTTEAAPVPGVDSMDAADPVYSDIDTQELPEAVQDPSKMTLQTGTVFEDKDAVPHPVQLRALNKVTGHSVVMTLQPGEEQLFGNMTVRAHVCRAQKENTQPDSAALMDIREQKPDEKVAQSLFSGWMFASSPSLTGLEHPVYDISVIGCEKTEKAEKTDEKSANPS